MPTLEELRRIRIQKLEHLIQEGVDAYPAKVERTGSIAFILKKFLFLSFLKRQINLVGRIKTIRIHGKAAFFDIEDASAKIQCFVSPSELGDKNYENFINNFDIGDFVEVRGLLFKTKKNEKTVRINSLKIITKALRPLPEKWHGLKDIEERYRKRYLDILMNTDIKEKFILRSLMISELRVFLERNGFMEFETPVLQLIPGGATARPFETHLNALNMDLYLRIAPELYLKRLLVGGFEKVYEIGRNFRNEGMDAHHNPEFTMLEAYVSYEDSHYLKKFIEDLFNYIVKKINNGTLIIEYQNNTINFDKPWEEKKYDDLIKEFGDIELAKKHIIQPTFITGFPTKFLPLAKTLKNNHSQADAFQVFIGGLELVKAFTELNNPIEQRKRFEEQEKLRAIGDTEAQRLDEDFIESLEYGMPPAAGFGIGIDRLAMLLTNSHAAREIILFPTMRPNDKNHV